MTVRTAKIEIFGFGKASGQRDNWKKLAVDCQRMTNRLWQIWLCHHANNDSANKLRAHFDAYKRWQETKEGEKPKWPCKSLEPPLTKSSDPKSFYRILSAEFPGVNVRTRGLLTNAWQSLLNSRKAASGSLPGWVSILFANESLPTFTRPLPIPFDKENAKLLKEGDKYVLEVRVERLEESGKSVVERCELLLGKRKCRSVRSIVDRILSGEFAWKGSNLAFIRGKWYAVISYEMPARDRSKLDADRIMFVRPGRFTPWRVRIDGRGSFYIGGNGVHVKRFRERIQRERYERKQHYRHAGSNQKGHGRKRSEAVWTKLSSRYKDFVKRYNNEVTRRIVNLAIREGIGRIVYLQPKEEQRDNRYLSVAGNSSEHAMLWDYFQFGSMLAYKCEHEGIEYGKKTKIKTQASPRGVRGVRKSGSAKRGKRPKKACASV